jgi:hypothetical protein
VRGRVKYFPLSSPGDEYLVLQGIEESEPIDTSRAPSLSPVTERWDTCRGITEMPQFELRIREELFELCFLACNFYAISILERRVLHSVTNTSFLAVAVG